jgi:hypothetical protein
MTWLTRPPLGGRMKSALRLLCLSAIGVLVLAGIAWLAITGAQQWTP